ncbi:unnamed protein product [Lactuca saligna]|uniref:Uncharacterized protein n=1 Tax=Lactuca saligna TaxID=75948 RepID=A0AA35YXQ5_LACSI|nr:unnamed protein product [Lactuca saligna]
MFEDVNAVISSVLKPIALFKFHQPSSLKPRVAFKLQSSSDEMDIGGDTSDTRETEAQNDSGDGGDEATNEIISQTHVRHENQIQILEKEVQDKDDINLIMQQVLIKVLEKFGDHKEKMDLALKFGHSDARRGEGWKWSS